MASMEKKNDAQFNNIRLQIAPNQLEKAQHAPAYVATQSDFAPDGLLAKRLPASVVPDAAVLYSGAHFQGKWRSSETSLLMDSRASVPYVLAKLSSGEEFAALVAYEAAWIESFMTSLKSYETLARERCVWISGAQESVKSTRPVLDSHTISLDFPANGTTRLRTGSGGRESDMFQLQLKWLSAAKFTALYPKLVLQEWTPDSAFGQFGPLPDDNGYGAKMMLLLDCGYRPSVLDCYHAVGMADWAIFARMVKGSAKAGVGKVNLGALRPSKDPRQKDIEMFRKFTMANAFLYCNCWDNGRFIHSSSHRVRLINFINQISVGMDPYMFNSHAILMAYFCRGADFCFEIANTLYNLLSEESKLDFFVHGPLLAIEHSAPMHGQDMSLFTVALWKWREWFSRFYTNVDVDETSHMRFIKAIYGLPRIKGVGNAWLFSEAMTLQSIRSSEQKRIRDLASIDAMKANIAKGKLGFDWLKSQEYVTLVMNCIYDECNTAFQHSILSTASSSDAAPKSVYPEKVYSKIEWPVWPFQFRLVNECQGCEAESEVKEPTVSRVSTKNAEMAEGTLLSYPGTVFLSPTQIVELWMTEKACYSDQRLYQGKSCLGWPFFCSVHLVGYLLQLSELQVSLSENTSAAQSRSSYPLEQCIQREMCIVPSEVISEGFYPLTGFCDSKAVPPLPWRQSEILTQTEPLAPIAFGREKQWRQDNNNNGAKGSAFSKVKTCIVM